ncbi:MAG: hypothetical protein KGP13_10055 [Burkholderiales bacterium]|jgi:hypothetical protein|nr:hypothetical protein [Burkholderiales bacterium]
MASPTNTFATAHLCGQALGHIRSTADFVGLMGLLWGAGLGTFVALNALSNLGIASDVVSTLLLQKLPSLVTSMLLGVRLVLFQSLEGGVHNDDVLSDMLAAVWAALINVVVFFLCALVGYFLGIQASNAGFGEIALQELGQHYPVSALFSLCLKTTIQALGLGWLGHLDKLILSQATEHPSRSATRLLWLMVLWILLIEAADSYIAWLFTNAM